MTDTTQTPPATPVVVLPTVFDNMSKSDVVNTLQGIKTEAHFVVQSGDMASSANASKIGIIAHTLLGLIEFLFPETKTAIDEEEAFVEGAATSPPEGLEVPPPPGTGVTEAKKAGGFLGLSF